MHHFVGADSSCISWGHAQYGELGYGPLGQKYVCLPTNHLSFSLSLPPASHVTSFLPVLFMVLLHRSSAIPKKVDILEGMHVMRLVTSYVFVSMCVFICSLTSLFLLDYYCSTPLKCCMWICPFHGCG